MSFQVCVEFPSKIKITKGEKEYREKGNIEACVCLNSIEEMNYFKHKLRKCNYSL